MTLLCAALLATACTTTEIIENPGKKNSITIHGKEYAIERQLWDAIEIMYPPDQATEQGLSVRVMADGAVISADLPLRSVGSRIDLASRDASPSPGPADFYFTFYISVRGENMPYYRILSWGTDDEDTSGIPYGGWFTLTRGEAEDEWIFEWELTDRSDGAIISTGYVKDVFERINS